jgi:alanyl-tRNA synthetase
MVNRVWKLSEIRRAWLDFFESKKHQIYESKSLIPINDPSLLWINSGVATLKPYFSGQMNPENPRITNSQRCIRTNDIENVGVTSRHHTLFEMLGNFSIGDYFKDEAIEMAYEFLTKVLKLDDNNFYITVYIEDEITFKKWISLGINPKRIIKCDKKRNFWDLGSGPCGPCTEIYYDRGTKYDPDNLGEKLFFDDIENDRYVEIWNLVFSQYNNDGNGNITELSRKNIDTGAGLERLTSILQDVPTNYDIDVFDKTRIELENLSGNKYEKNNYFSKDPVVSKSNLSFRVILDHIRSIVFMINEAVVPSNKERGYVLRRLIRRSMVHGRNLGIKNLFLYSLTSSVVESMKDYYPEIVSRKESIETAIKKEETNFVVTLDSGLKILQKIVSSKGLVDAATAFKLLDTFGYPIELTVEYASQNNIQVDIDGFKKLLDEHKQKSKANLKTVAIQSQIPELLSFNEPFTFVDDKYEVDAKVIKIFDLNFKSVNIADNQDCYIILDTSVLYATGGGQSFDQGTIKDCNVIDVFRSPNKQFVHKVEKITTSMHEIVKVKLNRENRKQISQHHSATHIMQWVLQKLINKDIKQIGSHVNSSRFTYDFNHTQKLTANEIKDIENAFTNFVNNHYDTKISLLDIKEAKDLGAIAYFEDRYNTNEKVRVVKIGDSIELCGGTHLNNTNEIKSIKILEIQNKGSGTWRMVATCNREF